MAGKVLTIAAAKKANIGVVEDSRGMQALHETVTALQANRRTGSANTKTRAEVSASGAKPWRQKGTGRARAGGNASPIWRGGGVVFGPRPRDYTKKLPRSVRRLALRKALGGRIQDKDVLTVDSFSVSDGKTKSFVSAVKALADGQRTLIVGAGFDEMTFLAGRNVADALLMHAGEVTVEQLLYFDKIILTNDALEILAKRTA